jgi:hypothetical protein
VWHQRAPVLLVILLPSCNLVGRSFVGTACYAQLSQVRHQLASRLLGSTIRRCETGFSHQAPSPDGHVRAHLYWCVDLKHAGPQADEQRQEGKKKPAPGQEERRPGPYDEAPGRATRCRAVTEE